MAEKESLSDIIQGLIDTDAGLISKLKKTIEDVEDQLDTVTDKINRGSGSYALLDINAPGRGGSGSLKVDTKASNGQCITITTSSSTNYNMFSGTFPDVKYGHYAICARVKTNNLTTSNLVQLKVLKGNTEILAANFTGSNFDNTSNYQYLYSTFKYEDSGSSKPALSFQLHTHKVNGIVVDFDYVYISMIIPAVYS